MKKITDKRYIAALTWLCAAAYLVSYLTRKNFGAITSEFVVAESVTKTDASLISVSLFVFYGIGQLVSGFLGDRISPRMIIFGGFCATSVCNMLVPICGANIGALVAVWGLNGLAQAMLWPPMVKLLTNRFTDEVYKKSCVNISWGSSLGTIAIYIISSIFIRVFGDWRTVFVFSTVCGVLFAFAWLILSAKIDSYAEANGVEIPDCKPKEESPRTAPSAKVNLFVISPLIPIMLAIIFQGMLRDGLETWMPSYLHDIFGLDTSSSILTSVGLPIFTIVSYQLSAFIYRKWFGNELTCATVLFSVGLICSGLLGVLFNANVALSAVLVIIVAGAMHGVNLMLISLVPSAFRRYGNVSFISGLLNTCTYIGSAIFTYGVARLADLFDWQATIFCWVGVAFLGAVFCLSAVKSWSAFRKK